MTPAARLPSSFSKVKYEEVAPYVWLDPNAHGNDILPLETFRSRIPKDMFRNICKDVDKALEQYGRMETHENEETRSRFIASVSSCPVSHAANSKRRIAIFRDCFSVWKCNSQQTRRVTRVRIYEKGKDRASFYCREIN